MMIDLNNFPMWAWNGHNDQHVQSCLNREDVIKQADEHYRNWGEKTTVYFVHEDGEHTTIEIAMDYDFYGWRWHRYIFTTRNGVFVPDEEDTLVGVFELRKSR